MSCTTHPVAASRGPVARIMIKIGLILASVAALLVMASPAASAHVVPSSTIQLDVSQSTVSAVVSIPVSDLESATGLDLGDETQADIDADAAAIKKYLLLHFAPTSDDGRAWNVRVGSLTVSQAGTATTTGRYQQLQTTVTLTPPAGVGDRNFNLGYDAVVDKVATHVTIVTVRSDTENPDLTSAYEIGVIKRDTVSNTVTALHVDLGSGSDAGLLSMVALGIQHIRDGTDHQLFLLTLLLPAPLLVRSRRWAGPVPVCRAIRRIGTVTLCFTLGHSVTLALGALGVPVPQQPVEALIALSILVAAVHAIRPIFPGREAIVAATFGLVHGLAFSEKLRELDLIGRELVVSLLGFNLGIEVMQLIIVAIVLPPLIMLARAGRYHGLRIVAALATAVAAAGWLLARIGLDNPVADVADRIGVLAIPLVAAAWIGAITCTVLRRRAAGRIAPEPELIKVPSA